MIQQLATLIGGCGEPRDFRRDAGKNAKRRVSGKGCRTFHGRGFRWKIGKIFDIQRLMKA